MDLASQVMVKSFECRDVLALVDVGGRSQASRNLESNSSAGQLLWNLKLLLMAEIRLTS